MKKVSIGLLMFAALAVAQPAVPRQAPPLNLLQPCKGKVTLLAFISTSCPHCKAFARGVMEPLYKAAKVCAVAIAFDAEGDTAGFMREQGLTFPVFKTSRAIAAAFLGENPDKVMGTPQVVVIDRRGVIQAQSQQRGSPLLLQPPVIGQIVETLR